MKLSVELIRWIESTIEKIFIERGYGHVQVIWHIKEGKLDGVEKRYVQTEKDCEK